MSVNAKELGNGIPNDDEEIVVPQEMTKGQYTRKLVRPIMADGHEVTELSFDFFQITAQDSIDIERAVEASTGRMLITPSASGEYILQFLARACTTTISEGGVAERPVGVEALRTMLSPDWQWLRARVQNFLIFSA